MNYFSSFQGNQIVDKGKVSFTEEFQPIIVEGMIKLEGRKQLRKMEGSNGQLKLLGEWKTL